MVMWMQKQYASDVAQRLSDAGLFSEVDNGADTLPKKIRNGEIAQYNFILGTSHLFLHYRIAIYRVIVSYFRDVTRNSAIVSADSRRSRRVG